MRGTAIAAAGLIGLPLLLVPVLYVVLVLYEIGAHGGKVTAGLYVTLGVAGLVGYAGLGILRWVLKELRLMKRGKSLAEMTVSEFIDAEGELRRLAEEELIRRGEDAVAPLAAELRNPDSSRARRAASLLGNLGHPSAVEPLVEALGHEDAHVAWCSADSLKGLRGERAVVGLIEALERPEVGMRRGAAAALGSLGDSRAVEPLIRVLESDGPAVAEKACEALGQLGDERAVVPLIRALEGREMGVATSAALALANLGDGRAVPPLLAALGGSELDDSQRSFLRLALLDLAPKNMEPILEGCQNEAAAVRMGCAEALGKAGDERAVGPLETLLKDPEKEVRDSARQALERLRKRGFPVKMPWKDTAATTVREVDWFEWGLVAFYAALPALVLSLQPPWLSPTERVAIPLGIGLGFIFSHKVLHRTGIDVFGAPVFFAAILAVLGQSFGGHPGPYLVKRFVVVMAWSTGFVAMGHIVFLVAAWIKEKLERG
jgi:HEAT repeat protein